MSFAQEFDMETLRVKSFKDLMNGQRHATIHCGMSDIQVRDLESDGAGAVIIRHDHGELLVNENVEIRYEPWSFDRGSLLFKSHGGQELKICTELDHIKFDDGSKFAICPDVGGLVDK